MASPNGDRLAVPKSATGGLLIPDNYILVAADLGLSDAIEQVTFNGRVAVEVAGRYELIEFFPEGASQLDVVVVTKTGVTYVSTFEFVAPEDKGIKDVVADWIGDTGVGERFYPTCEGVLYFEEDDLPFTMAMQGGYSQSVTGSAATPVGDGWYEVTDIGLVTISCTTQAGPFENSVTFETSPGEAALAVATSDGADTLVVTAGQAFPVECAFEDEGGRATDGQAHIDVRPTRRGVSVSGNQVTLRAAGEYTVQCLGSTATVIEALQVTVEADDDTATATTSANTNGWAMAGAMVEPRLHLTDEYGNALPAPDDLSWAILDENGVELVVDDTTDGEADVSGTGLGTPSPSYQFWTPGFYQMIPIPGLGTPLPGEPPAIEIEVDGRDPGGQRNLLVGYPNCVFPADALLQVDLNPALQSRCCGVALDRNGDTRVARVGWHSSAA